LRGEQWARRKITNKIAGGAVFLIERWGDMFCPV